MPKRKRGDLDGDDTLQINPVKRLRTTSGGVKLEVDVTDAVPNADEPVVTNDDEEVLHINNGNITPIGIDAEDVETKLDNAVFCDSCNEEYCFDAVDLSYAKIQFIEKWYCSICEDEQNKITYKCDVSECECNTKNWKRFSTLQRHYINKIRDPDHQNSLFLEAFSYKVCSENDCDELLKQSDGDLCVSCVKHQQFIQFNQFGNDLKNIPLNDGDAKDEAEEEKQMMAPDPTFYQIFTSKLKWMTTKIWSISINIKL